MRKLMAILARWFDFFPGPTCMELPGCWEVIYESGTLLVHVRWSIEDRRLSRQTTHLIVGSFPMQTSEGRRRAQEMANNLNECGMKPEEFRGDWLAGGYNGQPAHSCCSY